MISNHKLTSLLQSRTVTGASTDGATLKLAMDDGSTMTVSTGDEKAAAPALPASPIVKVRQQDTAFSLDLQNGQSIPLTLAEATSSVMVRDKQGVMEYAD